MKIFRNSEFILKESNDIYNDILLPLNERFQDNDKKCTYFYRIIGFNDQAEFIRKTDLLHEKLFNLEHLYIYFIENIPVPFNKHLTVKINEALIALNSIQADSFYNILERNNLFPLPTTQIRNSFITVLEMYLKNEQSVNIFVIKNFVSKLILWMHEYIPKLFKVTSPWNPKILYYGDIKKHSVYFLILLSQIGCDVLYINPHSDSGYQKVDKNSRFSILKEGSIKKKLNTPPIKVINKPDKIIPTKGHTVVVKLKKSNDIFKDILLPLNKRSGYVGNPAPILPVYFYRYIGINGTNDTTVDEYYNDLFQLDKSLKAIQNGFIKFTDHVAMPENNQIAHYKSKLQQARVTLLQGSEKEILINKVINAEILPTTISQALNNTIKKAFKEIIDLFDKIEPNGNISKLENFALKLIGWINKYFKNLYKTFDFRDNPKILFYGDIKHHEIYLLIYYSKIGCDVLYVNSDIQKDNIFKKIDTEKKYTKLIQCECSNRLEEFPENERVVRKATAAYNAAQEIQQVIYNEDVGLFKPWQFEDCLTKPVTLKTTYDELKILWQEEARIRPEFKVIEDTVYVPNLFAKIKGTHVELSQYWNDIRELVTANKTHFIKQIPFTNLNYNKRALYTSIYLFNNSGLLDKEKLFKSEFYKFGYLRTSLQEFIIKKCNELLKADVFINNDDRELKLKIAMTILTMDEDILRLIEIFDYPREIPKLIIYDSTKNVFSDEDAIVIAFLNLVGIDIVILTPSNYNNIEHKLKEEMMDIHQLPSIHMDLNIPDFATMPPEENKLSTFFNNISQKIRRKFH